MISVQSASSLPSYKSFGGGWRGFRDGTVSGKFLSHPNSARTYKSKPTYSNSSSNLRVLATKEDQTPQKEPKQISRVNKLLWNQIWEGFWFHCYCYSQGHDNIWGIALILELQNAKNKTDISDIRVNISFNWRFFGKTYNFAKSSLFEEDLINSCDISVYKLA